MPPRPETPVLGVDPGSLFLGWGVLEGSASRPDLVACGVIRLPARLPFPDRLHRLQVEFTRILARFSPAAAAVESPFHGANARASLQLAHARGVVLASLAGAGISVAEYAPATVKKAVAGAGLAEKAQVQAMLPRLLGPAARSAPADAADAVAVAYCHLAGLGYRRAVARAAPEGRSPGGREPRLRGRT